MSPKTPKSLLYKIPFRDGVNIHHILKTHNITNYEIKDSKLTGGIYLCVCGDGWDKLRKAGYQMIEVYANTSRISKSGRRIDISKII